MTSWDENGSVEGTDSNTDAGKEEKPNIWSKSVRCDARVYQPELACRLSFILFTQIM